MSQIIGFNLFDKIFLCRFVIIIGSGFPLQIKDI